MSCWIRGEVGCFTTGSSHELGLKALVKIRHTFQRKMLTVELSSAGLKRQM